MMCRAPLFVLALAVAGCASGQPYRPTADLAGANPAIYQDDLVACRNKVDGLGGAPIAGGPIFADAVIGASLGLAVFPVVGYFATGSYYEAAAIAAASGAVVGGTVGAATGNTAPVTAQPAPQPLPPANRQAAIDQCLRDDGYKVVTRQP
jgi:hypothetical protein